MEKLRVWHIPQLGYNVVMYIPVATPEEGKRVIDILACYDLFQFENKIKPDYSNASGLQIFDNEEKEWLDWELETEYNYFTSVDDYFMDNEKIQSFSE